MQPDRSLSEDVNIVDRFRSKLFDENPNYTFSYDRGGASRFYSDEIQELDELLGSEIDQSPTSLEFHDMKMPSGICKDMFKVLSRVMPAPVLCYEKNLLEPITSVFEDFQTAYGKKSGAGSGNGAQKKTLPDCKVFTLELISTNMLLEDIYAPKYLFTFEET